MLLLLAKYQVGMARSDTQDWCQSDIGQIFMIKHRKKKSQAHPIGYLSPNDLLNFPQLTVNRDTIASAMVCWGRKEVGLKLASADTLSCSIGLGCIKS